MHKWYIIYKDGSCIEGRMNCSEEQFTKRFIGPQVKSWWFKNVPEEENEEIVIDINDLIENSI